MNDKMRTIDINAEAFDEIADADPEDFQTYEPVEDALRLVGGSGWNGSYQQTTGGGGDDWDHFYDIW